VPGTVNGLDYNQITNKPIRGAVVQLVSTTSNAILATSTTSDTGAYSLAWAGTDTVIVRVQARTLTPAIQVEDNTSMDALWTAQSGTITYANTSITGRDLVATLGWGGNSYTGPRVSAAFSVLDNCLTASRAMLAARPQLVLPPLIANWSPNNTLQNGNVAAGQIGSSFWDGTELYLVGQENVDTDEFDTHTICHEWGHYFEGSLSRSDSPGGTHSDGDLLTPSLAFGEGYGYGIAAVVLWPATLNVDSLGPQQADGSGAYDVETIPAAMDPTPGWYSELTIAGLLLDLFDDTPGEAGDQVALGLGPIIDVLTGPQRTGPARTTIFSFLHYLKQANPAQAAAIDALAAPSIAPVIDEWGSNETNNGGANYHLPAYNLIAIGGAPVVVTLHGTLGGIPLTAQSNKLPANRFFRVTGNGAQVTVNATTAVPPGMANDHDIVVNVYLGATEVATANALQSGTETLNFVSQANATYVIQITDLGNLNGTYTATVSVTSP